MPQGMNKKDSYFGRHPYIGTSIIGFAVTFICCITPLRYLTGMIGLVMFVIGGPYLLVINTISFILVLKEKVPAGTVLSFFGGALGCLLAQTFVRSDSKSFRIISTACLWIFICVVVSGSVLLLFGEYDVSFGGLN